MKMKHYIVREIRPLSSGSLLTDYYSGAFFKQVVRLALLTGVLAIAIVLATGCSSTAAAFHPLFIRSVPDEQQATNSQDEGFYQSTRSPGFDPDFFGG